MGYGRPYPAATFGTKDHLSIWRYWFLSRAVAGAGLWNRLQWLRYGACTYSVYTRLFICAQRHLPGLQQQRFKAVSAHGQRIVAIPVAHLQFVGTKNI